MASVTLAQLRAEAPSATMGAAMAHLIEKHPVMKMLNWDQCEGDEYPHKVFMGEATAPHFDIDGNYGTDAEERVVHRTARIRPLGGVIKRPYIGKAFGSPSDRVLWRVEACAKQFMTSFVRGAYINGGSVTGLAGCTFSSASSGFDLTTRGGGGVLKCTVTGGVKTLSFKAFGDVGYGAVTTDLVVAGNGTYLVKSKNPYLWVYITVVAASLPAATDVGEVGFTSSTYAFDGCKTLVDPTMDNSDIAAAGEDFGFEHLDKGEAELTTPGQKLALVSKTTFTSMKAEARTVPGITLAEVQGISPEKGFRYGDLLVIREDAIPHDITYKATATNTTYIIFLDLDVGVRGLMSTGDSERIDGKLFGGLSVRDAGEAEASDNTLKKVVAYWACTNRTRQGLYILNGIKN
jgi:hypothetical protein